MTIEETRELHERYRDEVWLSPWRIDELFAAIDERDAKIAEFVEVSRAVLSSTALWTDGLSSGDMEPIWKLRELVDAKEACND